MCYKITTVVLLGETTLRDRRKVVSQKRWSLMRGNLVWDICAFVPSMACLTKEVVLHKVGLSKEVRTTILAA